jgi:simple sugar transport system permease protein/ribose transport system permease protein
MKSFLKSKEMGIVVIIIVLSVLISFKSNVFLRPDNIIDMFKGNTVLGIMALGMLLVIITGGIDVSVGAMVAAVTVIIGKFMVAFSGNVFIVFLVGGLCGALLGAINGLIISKLEIPPIVVTLGTMSIINGAMLYSTNGTWINDIPKSFIDFGKITFFPIPDGQGGTVGIPIQILFFIGAVILTWVILKYTIVGRGIYAIGGNPVSAVRVGYNIKNIQLFLYSYMGFMVGIAAVVHTSIMRQVDPNAFAGFELQVIAAVVLGGANILGGAGTVFGTILGVLLLAVLNNGLILAHIPIFWQKIVVGIIIVLAVSFDVVQRKREERSMVKVDIE